MEVHTMWMMRRPATSAFNGFASFAGAGLARNAVGHAAPKEGTPLDYTDRLRRLSVHDQRVAAEVCCGADPESPAAAALDPRTLALVRLAALVAVGGAVPSYGAHADAAIDAGATAAEVVDVLVAVLPVVGLPCVVAAAPKLALALGHDVDDTFTIQTR
jgi:4-carboxymuconolactone decarboxylase